MNALITKKIFATNEEFNEIEWNIKWYVYIVIVGSFAVDGQNNDPYYKKADSLKVPCRVPNFHRESPNRKPFCTVLTLGKRQVLSGCLPKILYIQREQMEEVVVLGKKIEGG